MTYSTFVIPNSCDLEWLRSALKGSRLRLLNHNPRHSSVRQIAPRFPYDEQAFPSRYPFTMTQTDNEDKEETGFHPPRWVSVATQYRSPAS